MQVHGGDFALTWQHASVAASTGQPFTFTASDMWMSEFRLLPGDPRWRQTNVIGGGVPLIAFPRTTVAIRHEGHSELVADPLSAVLYAPGQPYRRRAITEVGDDCTALARTPAVAAEAAAPSDPAAADRHSYRFPFVASALEATDYAAIQKLR